MRTYVRDASRIGVRPPSAALNTGNLNIIRSATAELSQIELGDALSVCVAIREAEPHRFERAPLRWLARFCVERREATLPKS
jgi:hypothetical protein